MAREFTRNIRNTICRGEKKEPLYTSEQNDLLSDEKDVFVHNQDEYHCLTDNIKKLLTTTGHIVSIVNNNEVDNTAIIDVKETNITLMENIESLYAVLRILKTAPNEYELAVDDNRLQLEITNIDDRISALENSSGGSPAVGSLHFLAGKNVELDIDGYHYVLHGIRISIIANKYPEIMNYPYLTQLRGDGENQEFIRDLSSLTIKDSNNMQAMAWYVCVGESNGSIF